MIGTLNNRDESKVGHSTIATDRHPVPAHIRTRRTVPRSIAFCVFIVSLITCALGISALAKRLDSYRSPFDQFLTMGEKHWGVYLADSQSCSAAFSTSLTLASSEPSLDFTLSGTARLNVSQIPYLINYDLSLGFSQFRQLTTLSTTLGLGRNSIVVETDKGSDNPVLKIHTKHADSGIANAPFSSTLQFPSTVFLAPRGKDTFSLNIVGHPALSGALPLGSLQGLPQTLSAPRVTPLLDSDFERCQRESQANQLSESDKRYDLSVLFSSLKATNLSQALPYISNFNGGL